MSVIKCSRQLSILPYHYGGVGISVQPANESVSLCVDGAFALDGLLIHRLAVHIQSDLLTLHANHHFVPLGVEEHRETGECDGLEIAISAHQEVLQSLLVAVQPHSGLFVAVFVHYLPDVPHLVHCVLDHAEGHHEGVLIREATREVEAEEEIEYRGSNQLRYQGGMMLLLTQALLCLCLKSEMSGSEICLLLGATGVGKTLLLKRLQNILYTRLNVSNYNL